MLNKYEKTYLVILILSLIGIIFAAVFVNNGNGKCCGEKYQDEKVNKKVHIIHTGGTVTDILDTGGTIGMVKTPEGEIPTESQFLEEKIKMLTKDHDDISDISFYQFHPLMDSSNMNPRDWVKIGEYIAHVYNDYDAFVIIHGTDTLAYTASAISFMFENLTKPIVFTGSMISMKNQRNDGRNNLLTSLVYASSFKIPEVVVIFDNKILRGCRSTKVNANALSAFASPNFPPLGLAGVQIEINEKEILPFPQGEMQFLPFNTRYRVIVIKLFPGIDDQYLNTIIGHYPIQGIVFELYGIGNAPTNPKFLDAVATLTSKGVLMIGVSQCDMHQVNQKDYRTGVELAQVGVIGGLDMTTEAALAKAYFLLSHVVPVSGVKMVDKSLRGELSPPGENLPNQTGTYI